MDNNLFSFSLDNGLRILLKEIHTAPIISNWIWYGVGSRNELPTKTGLSHWVEHMQFKGTAKYSAQQMDSTIARIGGYWNAFTSTDWTTYFETLPAGLINIALDIESDRMRNSLFDHQEVEIERTVILSEREGAENDPLFLLNEAVQNLAFSKHPYRNEVIGLKSDLVELTREDLYAHYLNNYEPNNSILCIAGDFNIESVMDLILQKFNQIPCLRHNKNIPEPEYSLEKGEHVELQGPGDTTYIQLAFRSPKADSEDFYAFTILESLLTGPSSLNMFGSGSISHRTSRLYLELVEKEIAVSVSGSLSATVDPSIFSINLTAHPQHTTTDTISKLDAQIAMLQNKQVSQEEINRAVKQAKALFAYGSDNITNQAFWLGYSSSFASYDWFENYIQRLSAVQPKDIMRIAQTYLQSDHRVTGIYVPNGAKH